VLTGPGRAAPYGVPRGVSRGLGGGGVIVAGERKTSGQAGVARATAGKTVHPRTTVDRSR
jgi:hypothetical protein